MPGKGGGETPVAAFYLCLSFLPCISPLIPEREIEAASDTYSLEGEADVHKPFPHDVVSALIAMIRVSWEQKGGTV